MMSAGEIYAEAQGFEGDEELRSDGRRWRKGDDVSNRAGRGSTAEGAVFEMRVGSRVVVLMMRRHLHRVGRRAQFEQKRRTAGRHEADGHIGAKQKDDQQQAAEQVSSPGIKQMFPHMPSRSTVPECGSGR